ncbi:MAG: LamG-like jellyroll fold domain-containing protein [Pirellulales bacterium]
MNLRRENLCLFLAAGMLLSMPSAQTRAATLDRDYRLGDDAAEGAVTGGAVTTTFDGAGQLGQGQLVDLTAVNTPTYVAISGRPDGVGGRGIQFNAAQSEYLHGFSLGFPEDSFSAATHTTISGGNLDYLGIGNRGFQFWARPSATTAQTLVMDTNQHGVRINANGRFSMRYAGLDFEDTTQTVSPNTWYHIEVVRPEGAAAGARMYVNGIAVAAAPGGYDDEWSDLVVGANTAGDDGGNHTEIPSPVGFTGGTTEFYSGIIDDLKMFVIGTSTSTSPTNYGSFNLATDNQFVASPITGIKGVAGDVTNDGVLNPADKTAFINGWMDRRLVNGFLIGDMFTRSQGDLNLDGITNIQDLLLMQNALSGAGLAAIAASDLVAVPEPTAVTLLLVLVGIGASVRGPRIHEAL